MFTKQDILQLDKKGISLNLIQAQIERFKDGFTQLNIIRAAKINDGIMVLTADETEKYSHYFKKSIGANLKVSKFVPASGAATRMFKDLYQYLEEPQILRNLPSGHPMVRFIELLPRFAFFPLLEDKLKSYNVSNVNVRKSKVIDVIKAVLDNEGLNYGNLPKGLIHFHMYNDIIRTPMEEHLIEGCRYAINADGMVNVHFTVSPEHEDWFKEKLYNEGPAIENNYETGLDVSFSSQKPYTDTISVTLDNKPFRDNNGNLVFRPGGHGALIENLNTIEKDIIFIKNIDNVAPEHLLGKTIEYKMALGGLLVSLKESIHNFLICLDKNVNEHLINEITNYIKNQLFVSPADDFFSMPIEEKAQYLRRYLNRPIRVCGMVKNQGEPGGGPFWVREKNGQETLQILESSQFNPNDAQQCSLIKEATHFNPVDLVCCPVNYKGEKFDLTKYKDPETGFISEKSYNGKHLKALELPGLWNGAMSDWITLFVEVPIETFNPVKSVIDLLRPQHQPVK